MAVDIFDDEKARKQFKAVSIVYVPKRLNQTTARTLQRPVHLQLQNGEHHLLKWDRTSVNAPLNALYVGGMFAWFRPESRLICMDILPDLWVSLRTSAQRNTDSPVISMASSTLEIRSPVNVR